MPANAFISFDHDDQQQVAGFRLLKNNPKHPLDFQDHSLKDAVRDRSGKPIKYPPSDIRSKPVRDEIKKKFDRASKLVVPSEHTSAGFGSCHGFQFHGGEGRRRCGNGALPLEQGQMHREVS